MPYWMKLLLFVLLVLAPSFAFGIYRERKVQESPSRSMRSFVLVVLLLMLWAIYAMCLIFKPATPTEAMPILFYALFGAGFTVMAGLFASPAWKKICYWAEKADKWMYTHTP